MLVFCICTYTVSIRMQRNAIKQVNAAPVLSAAEVLEQIGHERSRLLLAAFVRYAPEAEMEARKFTKMLVASGLIGPKFTTNDADIVFAKCKKHVADCTCVPNVNKINFAAFEAVVLQPIAEKLGISLSDVADALSHGQQGSVPGIKVGHSAVDDKGTHNSDHNGHATGKFGGLFVAELSNESKEDMQGIMWLNQG